MAYQFELYAEFPALAKIDKSEVRKYYEFIEILDRYNFTGSLVYYFHQTLDPWMIATSIIQNTKKHIPLIALQPYTMPPFTAAKMIQSFVHLYNRNIYINLVTGQEPKDLIEIADNLEKDDRYKRLTEFTTIVRALLTSNDPFTFQGDYYNYKNLQINSMIIPRIRPKFFVASGSGSASSSSINTALKVGDVILMFPESLSRFQDYYMNKIINTNLSVGFKINIIAKETADEAKEIAKASPSFRMRLMLKNKIRARMNYSAIEEEIFFSSTFVHGDPPMLVGSYKQIADYIECYLKLGVSHFIIGNLNSLDVTKDCNEVFRMLR